MNYKTCKVLSENFRLDDKYNIILASNKKAQVTDSLEKGYIYAAMFFYDEVDKEIKKLEKIIRKQLSELQMESPNMDIPIMLLELSRRVKGVIGDDSLDAFIKEVLGETEKHIALAPEPEEVAKADAVKDSILADIINNLYETVIRDSEKIKDDYKRAVLAENYVDKLTERQKKLLSPALKMVGFLNELKLDDFEMKNFTATFKIFATTAPFTKKEESIKKSLKTLMEENS